MHCSRNRYTSIEDLIYYVQHTSGNATKYFCRLGVIKEKVADRVATILGNTVSNYEIVVDSDSVRHIIGSHGLRRILTEANRGQIPIVEDDLLTLAEWVLELLLLVIQNIAG